MRVVRSLKPPGSATEVCWRIHVARTHATLADRAVVARSLWQRMVGLLRHRSLPEGEALILEACRSIHTIGMRFAIDAVFVDREGVVVGCWNALPPWRLTPWVRRAHAVIELPAGTATRVSLLVGDRLVLEPSPGPSASAH